MSIELHEEEGGKVRVLNLRGKLAKEDYAHFTPEVNRGLILGSYAALASGRWSYTDRMPVVSILGAGLWPLLQMTILPPLIFLCAQWWAGRSATKEVF